MNTTSTSHSSSTSTSDLTFEINKQTAIAAPVEVVWETMLETITTGFDGPGDDKLKLRLEPWPGGRYYRDLGEGKGHLWAHVQVIKPPTLLEMCGPMFMSLPVVNHVQYRIKADGDGANLTLVHKGFGVVPPDHMAGMDEGWQMFIDQIRKAIESR